MGRERGCKGFTAVEVSIVVAIIAVISAIALPPLLHWRKEISSGQGTRGAYDALRQARSRALSTNYQHMVSFDAEGGRYRVVRGRQSYNTPAAGWNEVVQDWVTLSDGVTMTSGADGNSSSSVNVQFNADGTARLESPSGTAVAPPSSTVTITIRGDQEGKRNSIVVSTCGRISLN